METIKIIKTVKMRTVVMMMTMMTMMTMTTMMMMLLLLVPTTDPPSTADSSVELCFLAVQPLLLLFPPAKPPLPATGTATLVMLQRLCSTAKFFLLLVKRLSLPLLALALTTITYHRCSCLY